MTCKNCEFWTQHVPEGTCSQKVRTDDNKFVHQVTLETFGCNTFSKNQRVFSYEVTAYENDSKLKMTCGEGQLTKENLLRAKNKIEEMIKGFE